MKRQFFFNSNDYWGFLVILISFLAAIWLSVVPLPDWMMLLWPVWPVLLLIFWAVYLPNVVGLGLAWGIGLLMDVIQYTKLGEHALAFCTVYFLSYIMRRQIKAFPMWAQAARVGLIIVVYQLFIAAIQGVLFHWSQFWLFLLPVAASLVIWPWAALLMRNIAVRFYVHRM